MIALSYLGAHWTLFLIVVLSAVGLGALAWFTKNLKYVIAAVALTVVGLAYQSSNIDGYKRKAAEDAMEQVHTLQSRLGALQLIAAHDAQQATADAFLNSKLDALSRETPINTGHCLDLSAARRVWAIGSGQALPAPLPARRSPSLLQRRSGRP